MLPTAGGGGSDVHFIVLLILVPWGTSSPPNTAISCQKRPKPVA